MKQFNEWLFQVRVPDGKDAHYALVHWLRRNNLGKLFTEQHKAVTYVVFKDEQGFNLVAKSCEPILIPNVAHNQFEVDFTQPVKVAVQLSIKKRIRPPNLLHESQSSLRQKMNVMIEGKVTDVEKFSQAWAYGVGNKRVYGLGCVRILQDE